MNEHKNFILETTLNNNKEKPKFVTVIKQKFLTMHILK